MSIAFYGKIHYTKNEDLYTYLHVRQGHGRQGHRVRQGGIMFLKNENTATHLFSNKFQISVLFSKVTGVLPFENSTY